MPSKLTRRQFLETGSIAAAGLFFARPAFPRSAPAGLAGTADGGDSLAAFLRDIEQPPRAFQAKFRWWWPHGLVDPAEIRREIDAMADAGFGGAEIADVHHSSRHDLSAATHGWGTEPWRQAVEAALEQASKRGMTIDHSIGPSWPAASSLITPDSPASAKELATGRHFLDARTRFDGEAPPPDNPSRGEARQQALIALQAAKLDSAAKVEEAELMLDADSVIDLMPFVRNGRLQWTAPDEGRWILISYWLRGSGQQPERGPHTQPESYVVDHFSPEGTQAIIDLWETSVLTPRIRELMRSVGGALFEDSIEMETHETIWTPDLLVQFERRRGYPLLPYLPLVVQRKEDPIFKYAGFDEGQVLHDWWQTVSELFLENHFRALARWADSIGLKMRGQPYGLRTDAIRAAAELDIAEGESLGFKNLDDYRALAGGRDMGGHRILSNEAAAYPGAAYGTTWQRVLSTLNPIFAAGVNQTVLHGFSYAEAPGAPWPGFAAFTPYGGRPGYAEAWGPRQPSWRYISGVSGYFSRVHYLLQQGQPQIDVAFLRQKGYAGSGFGAPWFSKEGVSTGWTHAFISPATLELPTAIVREGRLAPDGPAFKALVFEGDAFDGRRSALELSAARRLLEFARQGLPIIIVGDWSNPTLSGRSSAGDLATLRATIAQLLTEKSVRNAPNRESIGTTLAATGLLPDASHESSSLVHAQRAVGEHRIFYFCNASTKESVQTLIQFRNRGDAQLYQIDLWNGRILRAHTTQASNGQIATRLTLTPGDSAAFVLGPILPGHEAPGIQRFDSDSAKATTVVELEQWMLEVEDWRPGKRPSSTRIERIRVELDTLRPWTEIAGLEDVSGIGVYRCAFEADEALVANLSATLDLGSYFDLASIRLNDHQLPPLNPLSRSISIAGCLKKGLNQLEIATTTTLNNRLRVSDPDVYGVNKRQPYGLLGPARIRAVV